MKVAVICNRKNIKMKEKCDVLIDKLKQNSKIFAEKLDIITDRKKLELRYDVYILITNTIDEVWLCKRKIKNKRKILILTENSSSKFIMCCIEVTKNLLYFKVEFDDILQKIYSIYAENSKLSKNKL